MRDAFGVERPDLVSKNLLKPAGVAVKHEFRAGFGSGPVRRYLTTHFPRTTKAGRNQLKRAAATDAAAKEASRAASAAEHRQVMSSYRYLGE